MCERQSDVLSGDGVGFIIVIILGRTYYFTIVNDHTKFVTNFSITHVAMFIIFNLNNISYIIFTHVYSVLS